MRSWPGWNDGSAAGLPPDSSFGRLGVHQPVGSGGVTDEVPETLRNRLGVAIGQQCYQAYCEVLASDRWQRLANAGARPQRRSLFASTGVKDPKAPDTLYVTALAAPNTVNTMPEATLRAFGEHGVAGAVLPRDGADCEQVIAAHGRAGIDIDALAAKLQVDGAKAFVDSWHDLIGAIDTKGSKLKAAE